MMADSDVVCSDAAKFHAPDEPTGYLAWHEWAEQKAKTHRQSKCPTCGLYAVWTPKKETT